MMGLGLTRSGSTRKPSQDVFKLVHLNLLFLQQLVVIALPALSHMLFPKCIV